ncbi:MAG: M48 family metalloprotease [Halofilum sp. (in: g-proteobacteria)]|nr:M48 family metalloprotease [Halofilum sp. (in: g-proteobacteria)]
MQRHPVALVLALSALVAGCATNPVTGDSDFVLMSEEREIALGKDYHQQLLERYRRYDDPELQRYVERIGQRLATQSHRPGLDYHFTVLDDPAVNAFALPGGYVYITRGIMAYFDSEAALAGVLGHEIGHVTARHSVQQHSAATASSVLGTILLAGAGAGRAGAELFQTVQLAAIRGYGREHELQADRLGAQYLARAGYDPEQMLEVIAILADQEAYEVARARAEGRAPDTYHGIFATHPENDARVQRVVRAARRYRADEPRPAGHAEYLRMIDGMSFGPGTAQGVVDDHRFLHLELDAALAAPDGWTIDNRPERLVLRAPEDAFQIVVTLRMLGDADTRDPRALLRERLGGAHRVNGAAVGGGRYPGWSAVTVQRTRAGERRVRHAVVVKDDQAWYFAGVSRAGDGFGQLGRALRTTVNSLHALSADERRRARPLAIHVVEVRPGQTWADLAAAVPGRVDDPVARLRLLNGDYPDGEPAAGRLVKTLR